MNTKNILSALFAVALITCSAQAAPTYYVQNGALPADLASLTAKRNLFHSGATTIGVPSLSLEGYETSVSGNPLDYGPFTMTLINSVGGFDSIFGNNLVTTQGSGVVAFSTTGATSVLFDFDSDINALGIDITSIDFGTTVSFLDSLGNTLNSFNLQNIFAGASFFGVVNSQPFNMVRFNFTDSETITFDQLEFGRLVPEPATMASLLVMTSVGACFIRRRVGR